MRLLGWSLAALVPVGSWKDAVSLDLPQHQDDFQVVKQQLGYLPRNLLHVSARTELGSPIAIKTYPLLRPRSETTVFNDAETNVLDPRGDVSSAVRGTPFPTHYWLTCPLIGRAISELERLGYIGIIVDYLNLDANFEMRQDLLQCHQQYARDRWECLVPSDRDYFLQNADLDPTAANMKYMIQESGIAGSDYQSKKNANTGPLDKVSIKCLHTHYAHFCSTTTSEQRRLRVAGSNQGIPRVQENPVGRIIHCILQAKFPHLQL